MGWTYGVMGETQTASRASNSCSVVKNLYYRPKVILLTSDLLTDYADCRGIFSHCTITWPPIEMVI